MYVIIFSKGHSLLALFLSMGMISVTGKRQDLTSLHLMDSRVMTRCLSYPLQCGVQQGYFLGGGNRRTNVWKGEFETQSNYEKDTVGENN